MCTSNLAARGNGFQELEKLREWLPVFEAEEQKAREALAAAEAAVEEERQALAAANINSTELPKPSPPVEASQKPSKEAHAASQAVSGAPGPSPASPEEGQDTEKPVVSEYSKWMDGAEKVLEDDKLEKPDTKPVVSEYSKWMDGAEDVLDKDSEKVEFDEDGSDSSIPEPEESGLQRLTAKLRDIWSSLKGWVFGSKTPAEKALERAKESHNAAKKQLKHDKVRIAELEPCHAGKSCRFDTVYIIQKYVPIPDLTSLQSSNYRTEG